MSLFDTLTGLFRKSAVHHIYYQIDPSHVADATYSSEPLESGKHYFRLWLAEMFLKNEVNWFRTWHPVAHSLVVFQFGDQRIEIPHVAGPSQLQNVDEAHLEQFIHLNYPMTGLMPFNGGVVELAVALVAMKGADYVASVTKVLGDLSKLLVAPQLSAALNIAMPVASGIQDLLGGQSGEIHLGVHQSLTGKDGGGAATLRSGYLAVIRAEEKDYPKDRLWIREDRLRIGDTEAASQPLTGVTYMLFRLESQKERDDWRFLKDIGDAFKEALKYLSEGDEPKGTDALRRTLLLVRMSPDLTRAHRSAIATALREEFDEVKKEGLGAIPASNRTLDSIIKRRAPSVDEAFADEVTLAKLFRT